MNWIALLLEASAALTLGLAAPWTRRVSAALLAIAALTGLLGGSLSGAYYVFGGMHWVTALLCSGVVVLYAPPERSQRALWGAWVVALCLTAASAHWITFATSAAVVAATLARWVPSARVGLGAGTTALLGAAVAALSLGQGSFARFADAPDDAGTRLVVLGVLAVTTALAVLLSASAVIATARPFAQDLTELRTQMPAVVSYAWGAVLICRLPLGTCFAGPTWQEAPGGWQLVLALTGVALSLFSVTRLLRLGARASLGEITGVLTACQLAVVSIAWSGADESASVLASLGTCAALLGWLVFSAPGGVASQALALATLGGAPLTAGFWVSCLASVGLIRAGHYWLFLVLGGVSVVVLSVAARTVLHRLSRCDSSCSAGRVAPEHKEPTLNEGGTRVETALLAGGLLLLGLFPALAWSLFAQP